MLKMGLEYNPGGIDSNYFYADYLLDQGEYEQALVVFEKALKAPARIDRPLADQGRKQEIGAAIEKIKKKLRLGEGHL